jgi:hypothetical protein
MVYDSIVISKSNDAKIKSFSSLDNLFKCCMFRKSDDFICHYEWNNFLCDSHNKPMKIQLWGKSVGNKNNINQHPFILEYVGKNLFGSILFLFFDENSNIFNPTLNLWVSVNSKLYTHFIHQNTINRDNITLENNVDDSSSDDSVCDELNEVDSSISSNKDELEYNIYDDTNIQPDNKTLLNIISELTFEEYYFSDNEN